MPSGGAQPWEPAVTEQMQRPFSQSVESECRISNVNSVSVSLSRCVSCDDLVASPSRAMSLPLLTLYPDCPGPF